MCEKKNEKKSSKLKSKANGQGDFDLWEDRCKKKRPATKRLLNILHMYTILGKPT